LNKLAEVLIDFDFEYRKKDGLFKKMVESSKEKGLIDHDFMKDIYYPIMERNGFERDVYLLIIFIYFPFVFDKICKEADEAHGIRLILLAKELCLYLEEVLNEGIYSVVRYYRHRGDEYYKDKILTLKSFGLDKSKVSLLVRIVLNIFKDSVSERSMNVCAFFRKKVYETVRIKRHEWKWYVYDFYKKETYREWRPDLDPEVARICYELEFFQDCGAFNKNTVSYMLNIDEYFESLFLYRLKFITDEYKEDIEPAKLEKIIKEVKLGVLTKMIKDELVFSLGRRYGFGEYIAMKHFYDYFKQHLMNHDCPGDGFAELNYLAFSCKELTEYVDVVDGMICVMDEDDVNIMMSERLTVLLYAYCRRITNNANVFSLKL
jgi:hypothetical protein